MVTLHCYEVATGDEGTAWVVHADSGAGSTEVARAATRGEALEIAVGKLGFTIMDRADWPPGKIAHFATCGNLVRNVAVLRTGLSSLYEEVKHLEAKLPTWPHSDQGFDVKGPYAMLAVKFDWFSVSMLNLMEGVSLLDTLAHEEEGDYITLASRREGMEDIRSRARAYTESIPEALPLRRWRDKIAAHRSGILPPPRGRPDDSMATRLISLMGAQVMAENGRYVAPGVKPAGVGADPTELPEWSLTETWENLASRRYCWLNDGTFFNDVGSINVGGGSRVHSFGVASGDAAVREALKAQGIEPPWES